MMKRLARFAPVLLALLILAPSAHAAVPNQNLLPPGVTFQYFVSQAQIQSVQGTWKFQLCGYPVKAGCKDPDGTGKCLDMSKPLDSCDTNFYATDGYWNFTGWKKGDTTKTLSCQPVRYDGGGATQDSLTCGVCSGTSCTFGPGVTVERLGAAEKVVVTPSSGSGTTATPATPATPASSPTGSGTGDNTSGTPAATGDTTTAGNGSGSGNPGLINLLKADSLNDLVGIILRALVQIGSILLVIQLVYVGFLFVSAQGSEEKVKNARTALTWAVIGGLVLLSAEALSLGISSAIKNL